MECKIKEIRKLRGMTQEELAERVQCSRTHLSNLENGKIKHPSYESLKKIADVLDVTIEDLGIK